MGYSFRLEKVLNYKENVENLKKAEYGDVNRRLNQEEEKLVNYNIHKENLLVKKNESTKNTSVGNLKLYNNYLQDISFSIKKQENVISDIKEELEKTKEELLFAVREKKVFEKLKENDYNEFLCEVKKNEDKIIDGIVTFNSTTQK
ncbi:flagellar export protein FliJ [Tissierella sp.]|uniref:flagellar export protein FliJ n=1 Tax=Tissierella sp. TaxID=41274 RepID=UPI0028AB77A7|nr:flagellar export protein FliJ [Tissierella sp.]